MLLFCYGLLRMFLFQAPPALLFLPHPPPNQIVLLEDQPTPVAGVSRHHYPGPFTPLRNPPRCPVSATMTTATASIGKRYPGRPPSCLRRFLLWMSHTTQIRTLDTHPITRCIKRTPFSFCPSSSNCHARTPVIITGMVAIAATSKL